ncbi:MAG TPA: hypothetical protein VLC52_06080 [Anaerolineae bacterium]|nr:hypothetical protein [Anaerolineae bacterium]
MRIRASLRFCLLLATCSLLLAACGRQPVPTATSAALSADTPMPAAAGTITGRLCYPSDYIPAMTIYARNVDSQETASVTTVQNATSYELQVPAGTYVVFAWTAEGSGGTYSQFVACGLNVECTDHSLIPVAVAPGQVTTGADVCDFYGGEVPVP